MKKRILSLLLATLMLLALLSGCGGGETASTDNGGTSDSASASTTTRELRLSMPVPEGSDSYNQALAAKEYIEEQTNGELTITLYPADQLGDWTQVFDELMMGSIDMAISNVPETYNPVLGVISLAYLTYDYDSCRVVYAPDSFVCQTMEEGLDALGVKFFGISISGYDGIGTKDPIVDPTNIGADKGCLIRVPSLDTVKYPLECLGFRTSSIPYSDTYSSLQTGVVDGWIGAPPYQHYLGYRDVENYYYAYNSLVEPFAAMVSTATWNTLTEEQQTIVAEALRQACSTSIDDAEKGDEEYMQMMEEAGMTVVRFDADQLAEFAAAVREQVWPRFEETYGEEFMAQLMESLQ